jgi:nucleotide sugar dehydrogenase
LPLATATPRAGFKVIGFDIDHSKIEKLKVGRSYIGAVTDEVLHAVMAEGLFRSTSDFTELAACDVVSICVPTPLTKQRDPDLSFVENTTRAIAAHLRKDQLIVLESTTYPGTTDEVMKPILERPDTNRGGISSSDIRLSERTPAAPASRPPPFRKSSPGMVRSRPSWLRSSTARSSTRWCPFRVSGSRRW